MGTHPVLHEFAGAHCDQADDSNGYTIETEHRKNGPTRVIPTPITFSATPVDSTRPEPALGEHTEEVLETPRKTLATDVN